LTRATHEHFSEVIRAKALVDRILGFSRSGLAGRVPMNVQRGNGEVVMIVDDERSLVTLTEEMLAELGYDPVGFPSSSEALQAFRAEPRRFELVLTDEAMPDLAGTELASEIRKLQPAVPIILMSGHGGPRLAKRAAAIGVNEVLRKPVQRRNLAESLARALGASR
jgi:DNA-binding NtrC family response regulator